MNNAESGAGCIYQNPVEKPFVCSFSSGLVASSRVGGDTLNAETLHDLPDQGKLARISVAGNQSAAVAGQLRQIGCLPSRSGAEIEDGVTR